MSADLQVMELEARHRLQILDRLPASVIPFAESAYWVVTVCNAVPMKLTLFFRKDQAIAMARTSDENRLIDIAMAAADVLKFPVFVHVEIIP